MAQTTKQTRAPYGGGSVYFDASKGVWRGAITLPNGKRRRVSGRTKKEAGVRLRKLTERGGRSDMTVGGFCEWWLATVDARVGTGPDDLSPNTAINYRWALRSVIDQLGKHRLDALDTFDIEWLLGTLAEGGSARNSVRRVRSVLGKALDVALARRMVDRNVARLATMPRTEPTPERRALDGTSARRLLDAAAGHPLEAFVTVGIYLGLSPGELLGLTWPAVDLDGRRVEIRAAMKREPAHGGRTERQRLGDVKLGLRRRRRTLDLPAPALDALRRHRVAQLEAQLAAPRWSNPDDLVFTTSLGTPIPPSNMNRQLAKLTEGAGLGRWSMTELARHSAASLLSDAGVPLEQIADVLGHESTRMLERHYRHPLRPTVTVHVDALEKTLGP